MNAIRIRRKIESETLHLPELKELVGKTVEITIAEEAPSQGNYDALFAAAGQDLVDPEAYKELRRAGAKPLETRETFFANAPPYSEPSKEEMDQLREEAKTNPALAAVLEIAAEGGIDEDAIIRLRAATRP